MAICKPFQKVNYEISNRLDCLGKLLSWFVRSLVYYYTQPSWLCVFWVCCFRVGYTLLEADFKFDRNKSQLYFDEKIRKTPVFFILIILYSDITWCYGANH